MRHELTTEITIDAPTHVVWDVLVDLDSYADWNPFIVEAAGTVGVAERLTNRICAPGGRAMTFAPTVTDVDQASVFERLGRLGLPRVFDGRHRFELEPTADNGTVLRHTERFRGMLVPFMRSSLDNNTIAGFEAMNEASKARAEALVGSAS